MTRTIFAEIAETLDDPSIRWNASTDESHDFKVGVGSTPEEAKMDLAMQIAGDDWEELEIIHIER